MLKCLSCKCFIYSCAGHRYKSKCCSWILMWKEQIMAAHPSNAETKSSVKVLVVKWRLVFSRPSTKSAHEDLLVYTVNLSISGSKWQNIWRKISPKQRRKKAPRVEHLTSILLLSGRHKAEGHTQKDGGAHRERNKRCTKRKEMCSLVVFLQILLSFLQHESVK